MKKKQFDRLHSDLMNTPCAEKDQSVLKPDTLRANTIRSSNLPAQGR